MSETTRRQAVKLALSSLAVPFFPTPAITESKFPERPIRLIVPRAAGGPLDVIARQWAEQVKGSLGTVVVENMGGGGGSIGTVATARAAPDGYTIALLGAGELVVNPVIRPGSFDPVRDLAPINILANLTCGVAIAGNTPVRTLNEFVSYAKDKPGKMSYGSAGTGSMSHLAAELFKQIAGLLDLVHIPYKGSAPAFVDLMAGNINMMGFTLSGETPWQCLYFLPEPQGQASLRPTLPQVAGSFGSRSAGADRGAPLPKAGAERVMASPARAPSRPRR
jgi:tripartite-type tricarboxylate transporter receptor subunit TctC